MVIAKMKMFCPPQDLGLQPLFCLLIFVVDSLVVPPLLLLYIYTHPAPPQLPPPILAGCGIMPVKPLELHCSPLKSEAYLTQSFISKGDKNILISNPVSVSVLVKSADLFSVCIFVSVCVPRLY